MTRRSLLFSPASRPEMLRKGPASGADVVVFDLEDAVGPGEKDAARDAVREVLADPAFDPPCEVCVRLNPVDLGASADLDGVLRGGAPDSLMLPKVERGDDVETLQRLLAEHDLSRPVIALVETARGVLHAEEIADAPATGGLFFGAEDLTADVGATRTPEGAEVLHARQHVVLAAAAAGVDAIDTIYPDLEDERGLREDARRAVDLGFDGKAAIHPDQVPVINGAFVPSEDEVAWARRVVEASEEGGGGVVRVDDEMVDAPMVGRAERILERWRAAETDE